ncbi:hypothetical protein K0M31_019894, partial [Melipona bicolor]
TTNFDQPERDRKRKNSAVPRTGKTRIKIRAIGGERDKVEEDFRSPGLGGRFGELAQPGP